METLFDQLTTTDHLDKFHNTTELQGEELKQRQLRAGGQNRKVLSFFQSHSYENYSPFEVWKALGVNNQPITSIRRAISDLTAMGYLSRLDGKEGRSFVQRPGEYRILSYCWQLK